MLDLYRTNVTDGGTQYINYDEEITSYQCDDSFNEVNSIEIYSQGANAQICIETVSESAFEIKSITDILVSRIDDSSKSYAYIQSGYPSPLGRTKCQDLNTPSAKCMVRMQLISYFFEDEIPVDLAISGFISLEFIGVQGRKLSIDTPIRIRTSTKEGIDHSTDADFDIFKRNSQVINRSLVIKDNTLATGFGQTIHLAAGMDTLPSATTASQASTSRLVSAATFLIGGSVCILSWQLFS